MKLRVLWPLICACAAAAGAQDAGGVGGVVSGFIYQRSARALYPVQGLPGAAYLGDPVLAGVEAASAAPHGRLALAVRAGRLFLAAGLPDAPAEAAAIEDAMEGADRFAWSPDGSSAAVYNSRTRRAQVVHFAGRPRAGRPIELPGDAAALAVAGGSVFAGMPDQGVYLFTADGLPRKLAPAAKPSTIAIAGRDLYFADRGLGQVWQVRDFAGQATPLLFAEGLREPVGLQLAGKRLFVANAGDRTVEIYDLDARVSIASVALSAAPAGLEAFGGRSLWLLNSIPAPGEPLYVFDAGAANPAVYFIPGTAPAARPRRPTNPITSPQPGGSRR